MAPTIGRLALDNGFHGSIPEDWVAPPPQNIHMSQQTFITGSLKYINEKERTDKDFR